ncbi:MAG: hypothetical protein JSS02_29825, partial [Planctomycetes bacterium]|nr:hypothetical protein [Planctomycetota bacterium]
MPPANVPNSESAPWNHADYMWQAIAAATNAPQAPFGAVIVNGGTGQIIARGWNKTGLNPLLHGEIDALQDLFGDGPGPVYRDLAL